MFYLYFLYFFSYIAILELKGTEIDGKKNIFLEQREPSFFPF